MAIQNPAVQYTVNTPSQSYNSNVNFIVDRMPLREQRYSKYIASHIAANKMLIGGDFKNMYESTDTKYKMLNPNTGVGVIISDANGGNFRSGEYSNATASAFAFGRALQSAEYKFRGFYAGSSVYTDNTNAVMNYDFTGEVVTLYSYAPQLQNIQAINPTIGQSLLDVVAPLGAAPNYQGVQSMAVLMNSQTRLAMAMNSSNVSNDEAITFQQENYQYIGEPTEAILDAIMMRGAIKTRGNRRIYSKGLTDSGYINTAIISAQGTLASMTEKTPFAGTFDTTTAMLKGVQSKTKLNYQFIMTPAFKSDIIEFCRKEAIVEFENIFQDGKLPPIITDMATAKSWTAGYSITNPFSQRGGANLQAEIDEKGVIYEVNNATIHPVVDNIEINAGQTSTNSSFNLLVDYIYVETGANSWSTYAQTNFTAAAATGGAAGTTTGGRTRPFTSAPTAIVGMRLPLYVAQFNSSGAAAIPTNATTPNLQGAGIFQHVPNIFCPLRSVTVNQNRIANPNAIATTMGITGATYFLNPFVINCNAFTRNYGNFDIGIGGLTVGSFATPLSVSASVVAANNIDVGIPNSIDAVSNDLSFSTETNSVSRGKIAEMPNFAPYILNNFFDNRAPSNVAYLGGLSNSGDLYNNTFSATTASTPNTLAALSGFDFVAYEDGAEAALKRNALLLANNDVAPDFLTRNNDVGDSGAGLICKLGRRTFDIFIGGSTAGYNPAALTRVIGDLLITDPTVPQTIGQNSSILTAEIGRGSTGTGTGGIVTGLIEALSFYILVIRKNDIVRINGLPFYQNSTTGINVPVPQIDTIRKGHGIVKSNNMGAFEAPMAADVRLDLPAVALLPPLTMAYCLQPGTGIAANLTIFGGNYRTSLTSTLDGRLQTLKFDPSNATDNPNAPATAAAFGIYGGSVGGYSCLEALNALQNTLWPITKPIGMLVNNAQSGSTRFGILTFVDQFVSLPIYKRPFGRNLGADTTSDNLITNMRLRNGSVDADVDNNAPFLFIPNTIYNKTAGMPTMPTLGGDNVTAAAAYGSDATFQSAVINAYDDSLKNQYWKENTVPNTTYTVKRMTQDQLDKKKALSIVPDKFVNSSAARAFLANIDNGINTDPSQGTFPLINVNVNNFASVLPNTGSTPVGVGSAPAPRGGAVITTNLGTATSGTASAVVQYQSMWASTLYISIQPGVKDNLMFRQSNLSKSISPHAQINVNAEYGGSNNKIVDGAYKKSYGADLIEPMNDNFPYSLPAGSRATKRLYTAVRGGTEIGSVGNTLGVTRSVRIAVNNSDEMDSIASYDVGAGYNNPIPASGMNIVQAAKEDGAPVGSIHSVAHHLSGISHISVFSQAVCNPLGYDVNDFKKDIIARHATGGDFANRYHDVTNHVAKTKDSIAKLKLAIEGAKDDKKLLKQLESFEEDLANIMPEFEALEKIVEDIYATENYAFAIDNHQASPDARALSAIVYIHYLQCVTAKGLKDLQEAFREKEFDECDDLKNIKKLVEYYTRNGVNQEHFNDVVVRDEQTREYANEDMVKKLARIYKRYVEANGLTGGSLMRATIDAIFRDAKCDVKSETTNKEDVLSKKLTILDATYTAKKEVKNELKTKEMQKDEEQKKQSDKKFNETLNNTRG